MTSGFINNMKNLKDFKGALKNHKICTLGDFLSKALKFCTKKLQMSYV